MTTPIGTVRAMTKGYELGPWNDNPHKPGVVPMYMFGDPSPSGHVCSATGRTPGHLRPTVMAAPCSPMMFTSAWRITTPSFST